MTSHQLLDGIDNLRAIQFSKDGIARGIFNENGRPIRYIRDSINGNSVNGANHWVEIQAYDRVGNNVAINKPIKSNTSDQWLKTVATDGSTNTKYYHEWLEGTKTNVIVDIGFITNIESIKSMALLRRW